MHHLMQEHMSTCEEISRIPHNVNITLSHLTLHLLELLVESRSTEESRTHCDVVVFVAKPAIICHA
jgi:hypothetical protein